MRQENGSSLPRPCKELHLLSNFSISKGLLSLGGREGGREVGREEGVRKREARRDGGRTR